MAGQLRVQGTLGVVAQQKPETGQIGGIGGFLAGEYRVALGTHLLAQLDFRIPVSPFDQPYGYLVTLLLGQLVKPAQHRQCPFRIGLHHHTKPAPAFDYAAGKHFFKQLQ